jgi:hypothetical protein
MIATTLIIQCAGVLQDGGECGTSIQVPASLNCFILTPEGYVPHLSWDPVEGWEHRENYHWRCPSCARNP